MTKSSTLTFFVLVFALSTPFFWIGSVTDLQLMPGLSVSVLAAFCPMLAALLLVCRESGTTGVRNLLKRSVDFRRISDKRWYLPILLLMPAVSFVVYGLMLGLDLPLPISPAPAKSTTQVLADLPIVSALLMFAAFFIGALGEEVGWRGFALPRLQLRHSDLLATLWLTLEWALWHAPLFLYRLEFMGMGVAGAVGCMFSLLTGAVLLTWLYNMSRGGLLVVALFDSAVDVAFTTTASSSVVTNTLGVLITLWGIAVILTFGPRRSLSRRDN